MWPLLQSITRRLSAVVLITLILPAPSPATQLAGPPRFRCYSVEHGLSQSAVNAITQDRDGYLWFGTQEGLNKFDGVSFKVYRKIPGDSTSLSDDNVTALLVDHTGTLWVGTYSGGMNRMSPGTGTFCRFPHGPDDTKSPCGSSVTSIAEDSSGILWVGTWTGGLSAFDPSTETWTRYTQRRSPGEIPDDRITAVVVDEDNGVWVGTWGGLATFDRREGRFRAIPRTAGRNGPPAEQRIFSLLPDTRKRLWIGTFEHGLECLDTQTSTPVGYAAEPSAGKRLQRTTVRALAFDAGGILWIGSHDAGVYRLDPITGLIRIDRAGPPPALSTDRVLWLFRDREQTMWVGVDGGGVNHFDPLRNRFRHIRYEPGAHSSLANPVVRAMHEDRSGRLWIGTAGGGLDCYYPERDSIAHFAGAAGGRVRLSSNTVMALLEDRDAHLWIGTNGQGLDRMDLRLGAVQNIRLPRGERETVGPDYIMALLESRDGMLWVGTVGGGLFELDGKSLRPRRYSVSSGTGGNSLAGNYLYALFEDRLGRIWVGTWGAGISVLDRTQNRFTTYRHSDSDPASLAHNTIHAFHQDAGGTIWIATAGGGLDAFNEADRTFSHLTEADGLPNNVIYAILEDAHGRLWLSTNKGLCCFDPVRRSFRHFGMGTGLQSLEFNQGAYCAGRRGTLYFGGINGANMFDPLTLPIDTVPPPVRITECRVLDRPAPPPDGDGILRLLHTDNDIAFEFASLDFTSPELNHYRYILEGVDVRWTDETTRRYASYTNLASGDYVFRVVGSNGDGTWNEQGAQVRIHISSPFWETLWFRALFLLTLGTAAVLGYRTRVTRLNREKTLQSEFSRKLNESQEAERKRIAGELHDGLGQDLLTISHSFDQISPGAIPPSLATVLGDAIHQAIDEVRQISADLHPHMLERLGLTRTIEAKVRQMAEAASLNVTVNIDPLDNLLTPFEEINVYRIVQEALNNVIKHSHASLCRISAVREKGRVILTIADDGRGYDTQNNSPAAGAGHGLVNMAERTRLLGGDMQIETLPGNGTTLRFCIPLNTAPRSSER